MKTITQVNVAKCLGVNPSFISLILSGKRRFSPGMAMSISRKTGIDASVLIFSNHKIIKKELERVYGPINNKRGRPKKKQHAHE